MRKIIHAKASEKSSKDHHNVSWESDCYPYSDDYGDYFYSRNGGRAETRHVFITGNRLVERWKRSNPFTIAELGFGTGLNFFETWQTWRDSKPDGQQMKFVSFEANPLDCAAIEKAHSLWPDIHSLIEIFLPYWENRTIHPGPWQLDENTSLDVVFADALEGLEDWQEKANAWYLDEFSPSKNPSMWSTELLRQVFHHTVENGTFATYTAAGWVRQNLRAAGFQVERITGHGNKHHMSIGLKFGELQP